MAVCPVCGESTSEYNINIHLDKGCPTPKDQQKRQWSFLGGVQRNDASSNEQAMNSLDPEDAPLEKVSSRPNLVSSQNVSDKPESQLLPFDSGRKPESAPLSSSPPKKRKPNNDLAPLAEQMRPSSLSDYVGQTHLMGSNGVLRKILESNSTKIPSMILWGSSGVGKTTLARLIAGQTQAKLVELSAPSAGSADIKRVMAEARKDWQLQKRRTILFLDEIHRFNRTQQDSLLAGVEKGDVVLIGATTENPSFKLAGALLSRLRVFVLQPLTKSELRMVVERALGPESDIGEQKIELVVDAASATGDARQALNMLETVRALPKDADPRLVLKHSLVYDQRGDYHYDLISAFHKSIRGGDADAALYYLARMLTGGEDPLYVSRRLMRIASEDIGLADDSCLPFAVAVHSSVQQVGMPECDVMLAHAAVKFARAPKSVEVYKAFGALKGEIQHDPTLSGAPVPLHLRNAPTKLMKEVGYGENYKYNPNFKGSVRQEYLPAELRGRKWLGQFQPTEEDEA